MPYLKRSLVPQNELEAHAFDLFGRANLALERYADAARAFDQAIASGYTDATRRRAAVELARRDFVAADRWLHEAGTKEPYPYLDRISSSIDRGRWAAAREQGGALLAMVAGGDDLGYRTFPLPAATASWLAGEDAAAGRLIKHSARLALGAVTQPYDADAEDDAGLALSASLLAARMGNSALGDEVLHALATKTALMASPKLAELARLLEAEKARVRGQPERAVSLLEPLVTGHEQYQTHVALMEAYAASGRRDAALRQAQWLQTHRGLAYIENGSAQALQALNVFDSNVALLREAELQETLGREKEAASALRRFDRVWPTATLPRYLRVRRDELEASKAGGV